MPNREMTAEEVAAKEARDAAFQAENIIQLENTHRIVIPNFETNGQLYNSLSGANVVLNRYFTMVSFLAAELEP